MKASELLRDTAKRVEALPALRRKADHYTRVEEIRGLLIPCTAVNPWLFEPDNVAGFDRYAKEVNTFYGQHTKLELDALEGWTRHCVLSVCKDFLCDIACGRLEDIEI